MDNKVPTPFKVPTCVNVITCGCIVLFALFAFVCAYSFIFGVPNERTVSIQIARPRVERTVRYSNHTDTVNNETVFHLTNRVDSLHQDVLLLEQQHKIALEDLRQETNNIINKLNGWLGFWIAVSAIICVILPIVCQFCIVYNFDKKYNEYLKKHKDEVEKIIGEHMKDMEELRNSVLKEIDDKVKSPEVQSLLAQYRIGNDCNLLNDGTSIFNSLQWNQAIIILQKAVENIIPVSKSTLNITERHELQKCLIQASGLIQEANRRITKKRIRGKLEAIIHISFQQLENGNYGSPKDVLQRFNYILGEMRPLIS